MGARVSLSSLLAATALGGPARVGLSTVMAATHLGGPIRVSGSYLMFIRSAKSAFELTRLESTSSLDKFDGFGVKTYDVTVLQAPTPEHNPYRPSIPESTIQTLGPEGYDYLKENQEIQREQHNLTQAGDTTFPYQLMIKAHDVAQYRLGSIARFYHEDYGLILARYVQFSLMSTTANAASPCGLILKKKGQPLRWEVTNQLSHSHPDLVVGILGPYAPPITGQYGWVIIDGPNLQQVGNDSPGFPAIGEGFAWSGDGTVSTRAKGRILGRRVYKGNSTGNLLTGYLRIQLEGPSLESIKAEVDADTGDLRALVADVQAKVESLSELTNADVLNALKKSIATLNSKLSLEAGARAAGDRSINQRIDDLDIVSVTILNNAIQTLKDWVQLGQDTQDTAIARAFDKGQEAYDLIVPLAAVVTNLESQFNSLLAAWNEYINQPHGKFPVVDGSVPPNLVYMDDGSLVYVETF